MEEKKSIEINNILSKIFLGKYNILTSFIAIFLINLFLFTAYNLNTMLFVDSSRELYIPMAMNDGAVLYKDIFNVYGPLGYQINAFLTYILGEKINTFFYIGFANTTLILFGLFLILRFIIKGSSLYKISIISFITASCAYTVSQTNYVFPYSYSLVYALNSFIWSLVCILYFLKKDNYKYLYLSFFLYGISIACKYEFMAFILILFGICVYKKVKINNYILSFICLLIIPLLSVLELVLKGLTINDIVQSVNYILNLSKAKSVSTLYTYLGFIPSINSLKLVGINFIKFTCFLLIIFIYYAVLFYFQRRLQEKFKNSIFFLYITIFIYLLLPLILGYKYLIPIFVKSNAFYFSWIGIFTLILFIFKWKELLKENKYLFLLFISTILCSAKCIFNISFNSYGTYFFPLLFICSLLYFSEIKIKEDFETKKSIRIILTYVLLILFCFFSLSNIDRLEHTFLHVKLPFYKGNIYTEKMYVNPIVQTIHYIQQNTKEEDRILVLPEGAAINFLSDRKSHNKFYYLIPPNIEVFGEENIVKELKEDLPEYFVLQSMSFHNFNETFFCESFGTKICGLIPQYYEKPIVFGNDFWIAIYKKRETNEK